jgi:formylglycine-generating enzyme required for sulfatase activity
MSKSKLRYLITLTVATFCLASLFLPAQAAEKNRPGKARLVLVPLHTGADSKPMLAQMEAALIRGLQQRYEVLHGKEVIQSFRKASRKTGQGVHNQDCDEIGCQKLAAGDLRAELFASALVIKTEDGYLLSLNIKNVVTDQPEMEASLSCSGCDRSQLFDKLKGLSMALVPVAATPAVKPAQAATPVKIPPRNFQPGEIFKDCPDCPDMVVIPAGSFDIGSNDSNVQDEKPGRRITIDQPFAMGKIEITRGQFAAFVNATGHDTDDQCLKLDGGKWEAFGDIDWHNPGYSQDDSHPVACVDWFDAQAYVKWLSNRTGKHYQLPTESQWEYACRAGEQKKYCGSDDPDSVAWYDQNSNESTHPAGTKQANQFGLFDMNGNVVEWVRDSYHDQYNGIPDDGSAWAGNGSKRVLRGGSWIYSRDRVRAAFRSVSAPGYRYFDSGFRVERKLP